MPLEKEILLIEDNQDDQILIKEYLILAGFDENRIHLANRLSEGISIIQELESPIVLLDIGLPDSTGSNGLTSLLEQFEDLLVIILTGDVREEHALDYIKLGAKDYLVKSTISSALLKKTLLFTVERHNSQNRYLESEFRYKSLVDNLKAGVILTDEKGLIEFVNPQIEEITGYKPDDLLGDTAYLLIHHRAPKDFLLDVVSNEKQDVEIQIVKSNQEKCWVSLSCSLFKDTGDKVLKVMFVIQDISVRKQSQLQQVIKEQAFANASDGITIIDAMKEDNPIIYVNRAFEQITGYKADEVIGRNWLFLVGDHADKFAINAIQLAIQKGEEYMGEILNIDKEGRKFWSELTLAPIFDNQNDLTYFVVIQRDVTQKRKAKIRQEVLNVIVNESNIIAPNYDSLSGKMFSLLCRMLDIDMFQLYTALPDTNNNLVKFTQTSQQLTSKLADKENLLGQFYDRLFNLVKTSERSRIYLSNDIQNINDVLPGLSIKSLMNIPIIVSNKLVGSLLFISCNQKEAYSLNDMRFASYIANNLKNLFERVNTRYSLIESQNKLERENREVLKYQSLLLSSQLNPHFIFNALNSIQYFILNQNPEPALNFLSNFSSLMRKVMSNSNHEFIEIEKEIEFLDLYLKLEKTRHDDKFNYSIEVSEDFENNSIMIPPMLIQPFIENAVIHGIGHLPSNGEISVDFTINDEVVECTVIDNGVGRELANKLKVLKSGENKSFSSNAITKRLKVLNALNKSDKSYKYIISDLSNNHQGTKVVISFPLILDE